MNLSIFMNSQKLVPTKINQSLVGEQDCFCILLFCIVPPTKTFHGLLGYIQYHRFFVLYRTNKGCVSAIIQHFLFGTLNFRIFDNVHFRINIIDMPLLYMICCCISIYTFLFFKDNIQKNVSAPGFNFFNFYMVSVLSFLFGRC